VTGGRRSPRHGQAHELQVVIAEQVRHGRRRVAAARPRDTCPAARAARFVRHSATCALTL